MARATWNSDAPTNAATAKTWAQNLSNALKTSGILTQATDSGDIDWDTVTFQTSTVNGYEVFYLNDALHATRPIYVKVSYETGSGWGYPGVRIRVGSATDGAGTLTAFAGINELTGVPSSSSQGSAIPSWVGGDGSGVALSLTPNATGTEFRRTLILDRTRNSSGAANGNGFMFTFYTQQGTTFMYYYSFERSAAAAWSSYLPATYPYVFTVANASALTGTVLPVVPVMLLTPAINYFKMVGVVQSGDISVGSVIPVTMLGSTVDMVAGHVTANSTATPAVNGGGNTRAMLYYGTS